MLSGCYLHPVCSHPDCPTCQYYEAKKKHIDASPAELRDTPCPDHTESVDPSCSACLMWAAHREDLVCERCIDVSSSEPTVGEVCSFLAESILDDRIKKGTAEFTKGWIVFFSVGESCGCQSSHSS